MNFLPIAGRELRVLARRPLTYWGRFSAAGLALLIFGGFQLIAAVSGGMGFSAGQVQFAVLKWMAFVFACGTGAFLTADSLSEEKREGTLGLLFLTDLRGYDVIFGKLISHSLQASYGLQAVFPILGLTMLTGGVAGAEFARIVLIICNTVFLSLAIGLFVSSLSRDSMKAMNGTLLVLVLFLLGLPLADLALAGWDSTKFTPRFSIASPGYLFVKTGAFLNPDYWACVAVQHALAWGVLCLSCICAPRAWQEKSAHPAASRPTLASRWRFGAAPARLALRRKLLGKSPVLWLAMRDRRVARLAWLLAGVAVIPAGWQVYKFVNSTNTAGGAGMVFFYLSYRWQWLLGLVLALWVAFQASRLFVEGVQNGAFELLLVTPLKPDDIVASQWQALWRTFLVPAILLQVFSQVTSYLQFYLTGGSSVPDFNWQFYRLIGPIITTVGFLANLAALSWFGMWMGLTTRKPVFAVLKTLCFVVILPWIALWFVQIFVLFRLRSFGGIWFYTILNTALFIGKDAFFIVWARRRLLTRFRRTVAQEGQGSVKPWHRLPLAMPPVLPARNMVATVSAPVPVAPSKTESPPP